MLKNYLEHKNITMYSLSKNNNIPYSNINAIANNIIKVDNIRTGLFKQLATALNITMEELYLACDTCDTIFSEKYNIIGFIIKAENIFNLTYFYENKSICKPICRISTDTTYYIKEMALWELEKQLSSMKLEKLQNDLLSKEKE